MDEQREVITRIVDPIGFKTLAEHQREWTEWAAAEDFGDGPNKIDPDKLARDCAQDDYDKLEARRRRTLAKADAILALQSTHASASMEERDFQVRLYTLLSTLKADDFSNSDIGAAYADEARELVAELEIRALNPDAPSGESGEGGGSL